MNTARFDCYGVEPIPKETNKFLAEENLRNSIFGIQEY